MLIYKNASISDLWCQYKLNRKEIVLNWNEDTLPCRQSAGDSARFLVSSSELPFIRYFTLLSSAVLWVGICCIKRQLDISIRSPWLGSDSTVHQIRVLPLISAFSAWWQSRLCSSRGAHFCWEPGWCSIMISLLWTLSCWGWQFDDSPRKPAFILMMNWCIFGHTTAGDQPRMCAHFLSPCGNLLRIMCLAAAALL